MEDRFKFRGINGGQWIYGSLNLFGEYASIYDDKIKKEFPVRIETVGQSPGLLVKKGKLIYEGDVVKGICSSNPKHVCDGLILSNKLGKELIGCIKYSPTHCQFYFTTDDITYLDLLLGLQDIEILGNIYENPELLLTNNK